MSRSHAVAAAAAAPRATHAPAIGCASRPRPALRLALLACALPVWLACRGGDATAPHVTPATPATPAAGTPAAPAAPLTVARLVGPDTLRPGDILALEGSGFSVAAHDNEVVLRAADGTAIPAQVEIATPSRLDVRLPAAAAFPCLPTGPATLRLASAGRTVERPITIAVARRLALGAGESVHLLEPGAARCTELVAGAAGATYALAVLNTTPDPATATGVTLRANSVAPAAPIALARLAGDALGTPAHVASAPGLAEPTPHAAAASSHPAGDPRSPHDAHLAEQQRILGTVSALAAWRAVPSRDARIAATVAPLSVGARVTRTVIPGPCHAATRVTTRVAYVGTRLVILEDVASPLAGRMDAELAALGREYDGVMHPVLVAHMGDPLALDGVMQGDGRVTMLITGAVQQLAPGVSGFVSACNLYPRSTYPESNEDALFYARAPHAGESVAAWRRTMRSTVMHEAKHLVSFAERITRGAAFEESWLEEATARVAEELYARTFAGGGAWRANGGWADVVRCEVYQCDDRPLALWKHFPVLHDYLSGAESRTPLGAADAADVTFYASGWSLVRWATDHFAVDEAAFLRALVRGTTGATGVTALSRLTGRPADELLADWTLAQWLDDRAGFVPTRATLTFPSWHLPDIMQGLALLDPARYRAAPVAARDVSGDRAVTVPALRGWSASYLQSTLGAGGAQLLELRGASGTSLPAGIRLAVVRVR